MFDRPVVRATWLLLRGPRGDPCFHVWRAIVSVFLAPGVELVGGNRLENHPVDKLG